MLGYDSDEKIKDEILKKLERLCKQGVYWVDGKGCAVDCTVLPAGKKIEKENQNVKLSQ